MVFKYGGASIGKKMKNKKKSRRTLTKPLISQTSFNNTLLFYTISIRFATDLKFKSSILPLLLTYKGAMPKNYLDPT